MKLKLNIFLLLLAILAIFLYSDLFAQKRLPVQKRWDEAIQRLEFARDIQASTRDRSAADLLTDAEISLRRAQRQIRAGRMLLANRLIMRANKSISQAIKILLREPIRKRREKLEQLIQEAEDIVPESGIPRAENYLERGLKNKDLAFRAFKNNNFQKSLSYYNRAYRFIRDAIDMVRNRDKSIVQEAEDEAYRFEQYFSDKKEFLASSKNQTVQRNKRLALKLARKAEIARENGNYRKAIDFYHQAMRLLLRAINIAQGKTEKSVVHVYDEIALLDELIENVEQRMQPKERNERLVILYSRIKQLQEDAHQALEDKNYEVALNKAQSARYLIERMIKRPKGRKDEFADRVFRNLKQLDSELREIDRRVRESGDEEAKILLDYAFLAKEKAYQLFNKKNYRLTIEVIRMARRFALSSDDLAQFGPDYNKPPASLSQELEQLEIKLLKVQTSLAGPPPPEIQFYVKQAQKMLIFARENYDKGFLHVSEACSKMAKDYLERCEVR